MEISDKVYNLAKKLLALAKGGVNGEAENAQMLLNNMLKKYNITIEDIDTEIVRECRYDILPKHQDLFFAICWEVIPNWTGSYKCHPHAKKNSDYSRYIYLNLTIAQEIELTSKFDFYVRDYDRQYAEFLEYIRMRKQMFAKSYVQKQNIRIHEDTDMTGKTSNRKYTRKEIQAMFDNIQNMDRTYYQKRLNK